MRKGGPTLINQTMVCMGATCHIRHCVHCASRRLKVLKTKTKKKWLKNVTEASA